MTDIVIVGEAWGETEAREQAPFVGAAGYELTRMLDEAGIHRADCFLSNVFNLSPAGNRIEALCGSKSAALSGYSSLIKGKYVRAEFAPELDRLGDELLRENPNLIIALGNTAMWALTNKTTISKYRGTTAISTHCASGFKLLPTYHPAAVLRQWELRPVTVMDLAKAKREAEFPEIRRPRVTVYVPETVEDIHEFRTRFIQRCTVLSVDIETAGNQITCIGFAPSRRLALVVPIFDPRRLGRSYWHSSQTELAVWKTMREILEDPQPSKLFQNGLYDIAFLWRAYGIAVRGATEDTMLLHHALQPESLKSLGFLGSVYTDHGPWKVERAGTSTIKRDE